MKQTAARHVVACFMPYPLAFTLAVARAIARDLPPEVPSPRPLVLPLPALGELANGLRVMVIERHSLPVVTLHLVVKAGAETDPPGLPGTAQFVASVLDQGTERRSAQQIAETIDGAGGTVETGADWDHSFASLTALADHTELAFDLLSEIIVHPAFASDEIERTRKQTLSALEVLRNDPGYLADAVFDTKVFAVTPYSHPPDGTVESVRRLTAQDLRRFYARTYQPGNAILAIVGDITAQRAFADADEYFGAWKLSPSSYDQGSRVEPIPEPRDQMRRVIVVDKPDAVETEIRIGNPGIARASDDYCALTMANQILGGPASNRLFSTLRSQHGLTYGASSELNCYRAAGSWEAKTSTRTPETIKTLNMVLEQMKRLRDRALNREELETAESYLIGHQALEFETSDQIATQFLELVVNNLPLDYWNAFPQRIQALTSREVWEATRRYLDPDRALIVLVGNAAAFQKDLKKFGPVQTIPLAAVDLASAGLQGK